MSGKEIKNKKRWLTIEYRYKLILEIFKEVFCIGISFCIKPNDYSGSYSSFSFTTVGPMPWPWKKINDFTQGTPSANTVS